MMGVNRLALYRKYKESMQQWVKIAHSHQELKEALEILNLKKIYIRYPSEERPARCSLGLNETKKACLIPWIVTWDIGQVIGKREQKSRPLIPLTPESSC